jgi:hypothetical protein
MKIRFPKFMVEVPGGYFSRRIILTPKDARRREQIAKKLTSLLPREDNIEWRMLRDGYVYNDNDIYRHKAVTPSNVTYQRVFKDGKPLVADPPRLRTAADYFLDFLYHRRIDDNMVGKFPLLSAFLDAARIEERAFDLSRVEILARAGASELALCAGLVYSHHYKWQALEEAVNSGVRLGIPHEKMTEGVALVEKVLSEFNLAKNLRLSNLAKLAPKLSNDPTQVLFHEFIIELSDEQIIDFVNLTRLVLRSREAKLLYAVHNLCELDAMADESIAAASKTDPDKILKGDFYRDEKFNNSLSNHWQAVRLQYFLQVIPVVEELNVPYLTDGVKEAYFKAYQPYNYLKMSLKLGRIWNFSREFGYGARPRFLVEAAQKHVDNIIRLIREAGKETGLLPEGSAVSGRVKSFYSIFEKFLITSAQGSSELPPFYDILAFRVLVPDLSDVSKIDFLLRRAFKSVDAVMNIPLLSGDFRAGFSPYFNDFLHALKKDMESGEAYKKGYRRGRKNTFRDAEGVNYHTMILTTYLCIPMQVQIATFEQEESNERKNPHWEYKFLKQLRIHKIGEGIRKGNFGIKDGHVLVCVIDEQEQLVRVAAVPKDEAYLKNFPGHEKITLTDEGEYMRGFGYKQQRFENGTVLFRKAVGERRRRSFPDWSHSADDDDPFTVIGGTEKK